MQHSVLNLIISGMPSILPILFGPGGLFEVLNLIISGMPSIRKDLFTSCPFWSKVLNLIITGIPSILQMMPSVFQIQKEF